MMSQDNQIITISGFMGFSIGVMIMMIVNLQENLDMKSEIHDWWMEYEYLEENVCEDCYIEHFDQY